MTLNNGSIFLWTTNYYFGLADAYLEEDVVDDDDHYVAVDVVAVVVDEDNDDDDDDDGNHCHFVDDNDSRMNDELDWQKWEK